MSDKTSNQNSFVEEVEQLFDKVIQLASPQRLRYLQDNASSIEVIDEVLELLTAHDDLGGFLTEPLHIDDTFSPVCPDLTGRRVGVWQVDYLIGQGGMGRVYLAHRADGEYEQSVAFKVVEFKSFDNASFFKERQILADLDHPNIVSLFDAGTLEEGFPYLVMEYIDGMPLDKYIQERSTTSIQDKIILFLRLCRIVQSAHGHGIMHCDLKPTNILVTSDGVLKLLDFGIAQSLLAQTPDDDKDKKRFSFTPEYSSVNRHQQKYPTVRDDIFSLGIIFAQLITNKAPYTQTTSKYPQPDIKRIADDIEDNELRHIFLSATASNKNKALNYLSLQALIDDLGQYLDRFPVKAVGNSFSYQAKKNLQRNWLQWLFAAIIALLVIAASVSSWKTQKAEQKSRFIREMSQNLLDNLDNSLEQLPQTTPTRKLLIESVVSQLEFFQTEAPDDIEMSKMLAGTYRKLGVVTGSPFVLSLGEVESSQQFYNKALLIYQNILKSDTDNLDIHNNISAIKREIAKLYAYKNDTKNMQRVYMEMQTEMEQAYKNQPLSKQHALAITYIVGAHGEMHLGNLATSQALLDKAKHILQALEPSEHTVKYEIETRFVAEETANILLLRKHYKAAKLIYRQLLEKTPLNKHWRIERANARINMALACISFQDQERDQGIRYFSHAYNTYKRLSDKYPAVASLKNNVTHYAAFNKNMHHEMKSDVLAKMMQCHQPQSFMLPLSGG